MDKRKIAFAILLISAAIALPAQTLKITSPNGGETLTLGQTVPITWMAKNVDQKVRLLLMRNGARLGIIANNLNPGQGSYTWEVGQYQGGIAVADSNYTIRVRVVEGDLMDASDNEFTIASGTSSPVYQLYRPELHKKPLTVNAQIVPYAVITAFTINGQPKAGNAYLKILMPNGLNCHTAAFSQTQPIMYRYTLYMQNKLNDLRYLVYQSIWTEQKDFTLPVSTMSVLNNVYPGNMLDGQPIPIWLRGTLSVEVKNTTQSEAPKKSQIEIELWLN